MSLMVVHRWKSLRQVVTGGLSRGGADCLEALSTIKNPAVDEREFIIRSIASAV